MRADLPLCDFKNCKYQFDGNCTVKERYDECDYMKLYHRWQNMMNMLEQFDATIHKYT